MSSPIVVAFGYKARHGKDTAVRAILESRSHLYDIRRYAFADALKREYTSSIEMVGGSVLDLMNQMRVTHHLPEWVQYELDADMTDPLCPYGKHRAFLQWWGTEYRRYQDPFYWIKKTAQQIEKDNPQFALISDMRFINEMLWVKAVGGFTVKVQRKGFEAPGAGHVSEHELDGKTFDWEIHHADGNLAELTEDASGVFDQVVQTLNPEVPELADDYEGGPGAITPSHL